MERVNMIILRNSSALCLDFMEACLSLPGSFGDGLRDHRRHDLRFGVRLLRTGGEFAAAVVLPVQAIFSGKFDGFFVAVPLLEVGRQERDTDVLRQFLSDVVEHLRVLVGAHREGRAEPVVSAGLCGLCRFAKALFKTNGTSRPAFPVSLVARHPVEEGQVVIRLVEVPDVPAVFVHPVDESLLHVLAEFVFLLRVDAGVVIEDRDVEPLCQIVEHIAGTGAAAAVEQEARALPGLLEFFQDAIGLQLIIHFHITGRTVSPPLRRSPGPLHAHGAARRPASSCRTS